MRDFKDCEEDGGRGASYGAGLHKLGQETIHIWNTDRRISHSSLQLHASIADNQSKTRTLLKKAEYCGSQKIRRTSQELLSQERYFCLFLSMPDVDATNNHAERVLRQAGLWRKKSYGIWSGLGGVFVSRILSTIILLQLQSLDVIGFIADAVTNYEKANISSSLLPKTLAMT